MVVSSFWLLQRLLLGVTAVASRLDQLVCERGGIFR